MKTTHTPGPWHITKNGRAIYVKAGNDVVCCMDSDNESEATSRLIAAAPSLLAALEASLFDLEAIVSHNRKPGNKRTVSEAMLRGIEHHCKDARAALSLARNS